MADAAYMHPHHALSSRFAITLKLSAWVRLDRACVVSSLVSNGILENSLVDTRDVQETTLLEGIRTDEYSHAAAIQNYR